ncbi:MAG: phosphoribosyltransferase family protein [Candidatus Paceibacterota bacterium]
MKGSVRAIFLQTLFPEKCIDCKMRGEILCTDCKNSLSPNLDYINKNTVAFYSYKEPKIKKMLWLLKYKGKTKVAKILSDLLYDQILELLLEKKMMDNFTDPILVSVPISKKRKKKRGYNQVELIAKDLSQKITQDVSYIPGVLQKTKHTKRQADIKNRNQRLQNLIGTMSVHKEIKAKVRGRNIIILDDIVTTGATMREAEKMLRKSGAKKVLMLAVAH